MSGWKWGWSSGTTVVVGLGTAAAVAGLVAIVTSPRSPDRRGADAPTRASQQADVPAPPARELRNDLGPLEPSVLAERTAELETVQTSPEQATTSPAHAAASTASTDAFDPFAGLPRSTGRQVHRPLDGLDGHAYTGATFEGARGVDASADDGVRVRIPAGAVVDREGEPVTGPVDVRWTYISDKEQVARMPVSLRTRVDGQPVPLESFGMVDLSLTAGGVPVDLDEPAEISFPLAGVPRFQQGGQAPLYRMNERADRWDREGSGRVQDGRFVASVSGRGTWNCDKPIRDSGCVTGRLVADEPFMLPADARVALAGDERLWRATVTPRPDGSFCSPTAPDDLTDVQAYTAFGSDCFKTVRVASTTSSPAGRSCAAMSECAQVEVHVVKTPCTGAFTPLQQRQVYGELDVVVPPSVQSLVVDCGPAFLDAATPTAGRVHFDRVPVSARCHADLDLGHVEYRMHTINGGQAWTCTHQDGEFACEGPPKGDVDTAKVGGRDAPVRIGTPSASPGQVLAQSKARE